MSVEISRKASAPLEELEALAYDATEKLTYQNVEAMHASLSLKQHSTIPIATKTSFLREDDNVPKRYSSLSNEIWSGSQSNLPSDVRRLSVGSSRHLHAPRVPTEPEGRRGSHMQFSPSHEGRWGWETRLREAEADLSAVKAKRASFSSKATPVAEGSHVDQISNLRRATSFAHSRFDKPSPYSGNRYEKKTIERAKSSRPSSLAPSDDQHPYDDCGHPTHAAGIRIPGEAKRSGVRGPIYKSAAMGGPAQRRNTIGGAPFAFQQKSGNEIRRAGSDGAGLRGTSKNFWGEDEDGDVELNEDQGSFHEGEQRMPGVGDRWACQVLMEELTNMKAELQKAKEREGSLERQLRTVMVERDSIQRLWENEHSKVSDMKRSMQSALNDASNKLRARLSRPKHLHP